MDDWFDQLEEMNLPQVEKPEWLDDYNKILELVTEETLDRVIDECIESGLYACDLETTGLDSRVFCGDDGMSSTVDKIVGYCLSPDGVRGYYIPVRHINEDGDPHKANVSPTRAAQAMRRLVDSPARAIFHNAKFDCEFLQFGEGEAIGTWDDADKFEETMILAYVRNTRTRNKGLKYLSETELGYKMIELDELFSDEQKKVLGDRKNFAMLDPTWEASLWYAASDALCTYLLFQGQQKGEGLEFKGLYVDVMNPEPHGMNQKTIYKLEKMCLASTRWMERNRIFINRDKVKELIRLGQQEWFDSLEQVYSEAQIILGRDIRPGWYRVMRGTEDAGEKWDPNAMRPNYMEAREEAIKDSLRARLDPTLPGSGKPKVATIMKEVPMIINKQKLEKVTFPVVYDVTIAAQLGLLMRELGVEGLIATEKSGQVKTSADVLDRIIDSAGEQFPFMAKVKRFRETKIALSNNLFPIYNDSTPERSPDGCIKVGFNGLKVDTGRFATPKPRKKEFFGQARWNIHSIPATYDKNKPECMLRIREAVAARPGSLLFAIDYSGVELRIVTNLSREPKWMTEFFRCSNCENTFDRGDGRSTPDAPPSFCPKCGSDKIGDLHSLTALSVYGDGIKGTKQFKAKRQAAKSLNFAMCYGGGPSAAQRAVGVDRDEGYRIKRQFDASYKGLTTWWKQQHAFAKKYKYVTTLFGRRYPLPDIDHEMGGFRSKAERNAVNGPVQGTSADITKLAMALVYLLCKERGWLRKVRMTITIHDELVFEIDKDIVEEAVTAICEVMTKNKYVLAMKQPIPLKVDVEFGEDWTVPHNLTEMANNQGGGPWSADLAKMFPKSYISYLEHGGTPLEDFSPATPIEVEVKVKSQAGVEGTSDKEDFKAPETGKGKVYVHTIHSAKLSYGLMEKVAQLIVKCEGRGTQPLRLVDEDGTPLFEREPLVAAMQFKVLAEEHGF